jgi:hypothetical protein
MEPQTPRQGSAGPRLRDGIDIVYFDGGGAHRSAALSLRDALLERNPRRDVRVLNTAEIFPLAPLLDWSSSLGIRVYNASLKQERMWLGDLPRAVRVGVRVAQMLHTSSVQRLRAFWRNSAPRVLVSTIPIYNRLLIDSLRLERPDAGAVIIPCDFEEISENYWFDVESDADYLCGTARLASNARAAGVPPMHIRSLPGMVTHPKFHASNSLDVAAERSRLGLDPRLPTVLLFFGGQGSRRTVELARRLDAGPRGMNLIAVCGRNQQALEELSAWRSKNPKHVVGFSEEVVRFMRLSDVLVGRPGPLSIFEALASRLPMVLWDNPGFSVLFEYNLIWVENAGVGLRVRSADEVPAAVDRILATPSFRGSTERFGVSAAIEAARLVEEKCASPGTIAAAG